jgi:hypothetical protein
MMVSESKLRVGTLGSAATFAGEATSRMRESHPEYGEPAYFPSMEDCWEALKKGAVDAVVLGVERTGQPHHGDPIVAQGFYVIGESSQPLECNLYVKPGTKKSDVRKITGHGSILQCKTYLDREFPGIPRERHELNSVEAARDVMAGEGTLAVVGSRSLAHLVTGLETFASDIGDGATCSWWAVSSRPLFSERPGVVVLASRCGRGGQLGRLAVALRNIGYLLETSAAFPVNSGVSVYDYMLTFAGQGLLEQVKETISRFGDTRLVGAFAKRD